jgi:hypothetical protein
LRRREFLVASASIAGGMLGQSTLADALPCPPDTLSATGGSSINTSCASGLAGTQPAWFKGMPAMRWIPLAGGSSSSENWQRGARLTDAVPPPPYFNNYSPRSLTAGWNGACVDPDNMEMIVALNGGHAARQENDAYALSLDSDMPGWRRIVESTPLVDASSGAEYLTRSPVTDNAGNKYLSPMLVPGWTLDGPHPGIAFNDRNPDLRLIHRRPRTLHTCSHYHYSNGKVWYPILNSWDRGTGDTSLVKLALDVDALRHNPALGKWRYGDLGPWQYLGTIREQAGGAMDSFGFGVAALDRSTGKIWYTGQKTSNYWSMTTTGKDAGQHEFFSDAPRAKDFSSTAGAIAERVSTSDGRTTSLFVIMEQGSYRVWILDTTLAGSGRAWSVVDPKNSAAMQWSFNLQKVTPGYEGYPAAYGMVYHAPSGHFLVYNCDQLPDRAAVRILSMPLNSDGTYDARGSWQWGEVRLGTDGPGVNNPTALGIGGGGGSYTRFNCFPDFAGTSDSLLIHLSTPDTPTWVCRLPAKSLT